MQSWQPKGHAEIEYSRASVVADKLRSSTNQFQVHVVLHRLPI